MGYLKVLLKKNWILWKRGGKSSYLEILFPLAFMCFFYLFRELIDKDNIDERSYLVRNLQKNEPYPQPLFPDFPDEFKNLPLKEQIKQGPVMKDCLADDKRTGFVALAPPNNFITDMLEQNLQYYGYDVVFFEDREAIFKNQTHPDYDENMCLGVSVQQTGQDGVFKYSLHFNTSTFDDNEVVEIPGTDAETYISYKFQDLENNLDSYVDSGFLTIQNWIDNEILRKEANNNNLQIFPKVTSQRVEDHTDDELPDVMETNFATFTILPLIIVYLRFLSLLMNEKETKMREQMRIMGMTDSSLYLSWIIYYGIVFTIIALVSAFIMATSVFPSSNYTVLFIWYWVYCLNVLFMALWVQTFFTQSKVGIIFGMVVYLGLYVLNFVVQGDNEMSIGRKTSFSLIPQVSVSLGAQVFSLVENRREGINWDNIDQQIDNFTVLRSLYMSLVSLAIFIVLFLYCDQVIPNEFGTKRHPLLCLKRSKKSTKQTEQQKIEEEMDLEQKQNQDNIEPVEALLSQKEKDGNALSIKQLSKTYGSGKKAVKNLSLTMYNDQISCLLGHNGAGKTTTISMLTGMIGITKGTAKVYGLDIESQMNEVRKIMGVCPQHDILYGNLTVQEHLEFFAVLKGMSNQQEIQQQVTQMMDDVDLTFKKDALAKTLSGGQKRRLSVAMAFIGGSKLIYLDEPTSGCDTSVRRHIWDMLRRYKQDRIIILTTHFMDEADYLGDRISIVGNGKLICSGSSNYLKTKFGVGYNLTIVKETNMVCSKSIEDLIHKHIPSALKYSDVSQEMQFQLKMEEIDKFEALFTEIDKKKQHLQISNYGISITTMEEVFLKVAELQAEDIKLGASLMRKSSLQSINKIQPSIKNISQQKEKQNQKQKENLPVKYEEFDLETMQIKNPAEMFWNQFWALCQKRYYSFIRDRKSLFCEIVIPVILLIFGVWTLTIDTYDEDPMLLLSPTIYKQIQPVLVGRNPTVPLNDISEILEGFSQKNYDFQLLPDATLEEFDLKNFEERKEERRGAYFFNQINPTSHDYLLEVATLNKDACPLYLNQMNQAIIREQLNNPQLKIELTVDPFEYTERFKSLQTSNKGIGAAFVFSMLLSFVPASIITYIVMEKTNNIKHQQIVSGVNLPSYYLSSYLIDFVKFLFPLCTMCALMILAFDLSFYTDEGDVYSAVVLLFILYGFSIIPFTYAFSFLFTSPGSAQVASFFIHYIVGSILPLIFWILRVFVDSARSVAIALEWIFRFMPSFALGNALVNIASRETYVVVDDDVTELQSPYHIDIAGSDIIFMFGMAFVGLGVLALLEHLKRKGTIDRMLVSGKGFPEYQEKLYDDDVQKERNQVKEKTKDDYAIRLNQVRKVFKQQNTYLEAVDSVSFGINQGECFTLLGINGAGKTTLFKILTGDHLATKGEVHINGFDVGSEMDNARMYIGYCPQFDALLDNLTSREHLNLYAAIKGIPKHLRKEIVDQKILEMDLTKYADIPAGTYSGGNKRKLSVAVAMIGNPPVVLLDEPSTGMDPKSRRFMWDVISRISTERKKSSVILTTHSMEEAEALSTKMTIMVEGNLKCLGSIQHIKSKFGQGYELEMKVNIPKQGEMKQVLNNTGLQLDQIVTQPNLKAILLSIGFQQYEEQISVGKQGELLFNQMNSVSGLRLENLIEYLITERNIEKVGEFLGQNFGTYSVIEHFGTYSRYKISENIAIGKIFGILQKSKDLLHICSYSVNQASIEQIFNNFAINQIKTEDFNKGGKFYREEIKQESLQNLENPRDSSENMELQIESNTKILTIANNNNQQVLYKEAQDDHFSTSQNSDSDKQKHQINIFPNTQNDQNKFSD